MPVTVALGARSRLSIGYSRMAGWWVVRWHKTEPSGWEGWDPRWDDDSPDAGVREPRIPPLSPRHGAAELPEPD